jgi:hypothetical protein
MTETQLTLIVSAPLGKMIVSRDPIDKMIGRFHIPDGFLLERLPATGLCIIHSPVYDPSEDMTGRRIVFSPFEGVPWTLEGTEFYTIPEGACLAVFERNDDDQRRDGEGTDRPDQQRGDGEQGLGTD